MRLPATRSFSSPVNAATSARDAKGGKPVSVAEAKEQRAAKAKAASGTKAKAAGTKRAKADEDEAEERPARRRKTA